MSVYKGSATFCLVKTRCCSGAVFFTMKCVHQPMTLPNCCEAKVLAHKAGPPCLVILECMFKLPCFSVF